MPLPARRHRGPRPRNLGGAGCGTGSRRLRACWCMPRDAPGCIRAVVRVRPLLPHEEDTGEKSCCEVTDERTCLVRLGGNQWRQYSFDACLASDCSQKQVFQECGATNLLDSALAGYSTTVLAYGQTGSGKTHTMLGKLSTPDSFSASEDG